MRSPTRRVVMLVALWCVAMSTVWLVAASRVGYGAGIRQNADAVDALSTWDGRHYTTLAVQGYNPEGIEARRFAFFPLLPLLARAAGGESHAGLAGVLLSQLLFLAALLLLSDLTKNRQRSESIWSDPALWLLVSPLSFFFAMFYTESLFLACTLFAVWATARGRPGWGFISGLLAGLTRPTAICLPFLFAGQALAAARRGRPWKQLLVVATAPIIGVVIYVGAVGIWSGRVDGYVRVQHDLWGAGNAVPYLPLVNLILAVAGEARAREFPPYDQLVAIGSALGVLGLLGWGWRRLPLGWLAYTVASLLLIHSSLPYRSGARYEVVLFPVFVLIPLTILGTRRVAPVAAGFAVLLQLFLLSQAASWQWVS